MGDLVLGGCSLEPLGDYLKAVGLLRLLGTQVDPRITGRWRGDEFTLSTDMSEDDIVDYLLDRYVPTPIITPWNSGSGFGANDARKSKAAYQAVESIATSSDPRLEPYRRSIAAARSLAQRADWSTLEKQEKVALCRNASPDALIDWIDAAVVLTAESRAFPPLLGTGGNDGRLDFGSNAMQRLLDVLGVSDPVRSRDDRRGLAAHAVLGDGDVKMDRAAAGQFHPYATGGPASSPTGNTTSLSNPWTFVLAFEGAVAFASGVAKKLGTIGNRPGVSAVPFTVASVGAAFASATAENSRGEFWAPVWEQPATWRELERTISEARVEYRGGSALTAIDFARAVATFGTDRGIGRFVRYGFLERNGLSTFCVPLGVRRVRHGSGAQVLGQLDEWLGRVRRTSNRPGSADALLRSIDERQFQIADRDDPISLQILLASVAQLERLASRSRGLRDATRTPINRLRASDWLALLDDGSAEFRIAVGLASLRGPKERWGFVRHLTIDLDWSGRAAAVDGWGHRSIIDVLAEVVVLLARQPVSDGEGRHAWCGPATAIWVPPADFGAFAANQIDLDRLDLALSGLTLLDWRGAVLPVPGETASTRVPTAVNVLKPLFHHRGLGDHTPRGRPLLADREVARLLGSAQVERALRSATRTLRIAGCVPYLNDLRSVALGVGGRHVAATCLIPISDRASLRLLNQVADVGAPAESEPMP